jgi:hypothetical protein
MEYAYATLQYTVGEIHRTTFQEIRSWGECPCVARVSAVTHAREISSRIRWWSRRAGTLSSVAAHPRPPSHRRFCLPRSFCSCVVSVCIFFPRYCSLCYSELLLLLFIIFSLLFFTFPCLWCDTPFWTRQAQ